MAARLLINFNSRQELQSQRLLSREINFLQPLDPPAKVPWLLLLTGSSALSETAQRRHKTGMDSRLLVVPGPVSSPGWLMLNDDDDPGELRGSVSTFPAFDTH